MTKRKKEHTKRKRGKSELDDDRKTEAMSETVWKTET
jgi:hypothetical protein